MCYYKNKVLFYYPNAYIQEIDVDDIGGRGSNSHRINYEIRVPLKLFWIIKTYITIGTHITPVDAWENAFKNLNKTK
jgi:hypothetical protein